MKLQTIVLIGAGLFLVYKLGKRFNGNKQPRLVKNTEGVLTQGIEEIQTPSDPGVIGKTESGENVAILIQTDVPVDRSIFPGSVLQKYEVKDAGETVKTYDPANY